MFPTKDYNTLCLAGLLSLVLLIIPLALVGQNVVSGVVFDSQTGESLPYATVYVNGTTNGTITDRDGHFELRDIAFPSTIVASFVGYEPQTLDLSGNPGELTIRLKTNNELPEVEISGKINKEDLKYFKRMLLGDNKWGRHATIKNENVLMFYRSEPGAIEVVGRDGIKHKTDGSTQVFNAWASEPLIIDLPLLGYELYLDLERFTVEQTSYRTLNSGAQKRESSDIQGYFYYRSYADEKGKLKAKSIEENRLEVYYNSSQHFLRSLYENRLAENGYVLFLFEGVSVTSFDSVDSSSTVLKPQVSPIDLNSYTTVINDDMMMIQGLNNKSISIRYYHKPDGSPLNLNDVDPTGDYSASGFTPKQDTCIILKEGAVLDNAIIFSGDMANKRVGASLPIDYVPSIPDKDW